MTMVMTAPTYLCYYYDKGYYDDDDDDGRSESVERSEICIPIPRMSYVNPLLRYTAAITYTTPGN